MKHALIRALLAAVLSLWLTTSAWAGYNEGAAAFESYDYETALTEWLPLAEAGDPNAQVGVGYLYLNGYGVEVDYSEALKWLRLGSEQGHQDGQVLLGTMYDNGWGVAKNPAEAVRWYRAAAEQGEPDAQVYLGLKFATGSYVDQNYIEAYKWFSLASGQATTSLVADLMSPAELRDFVAGKMTPADISEAQRLAREWLEQHGE